MLILNFLITLIIPYFSVFNKLTPPDTIPAYFYSPEAAFASGEFFSIAFFWAGFWRNAVAAGELSEKQYFMRSFIFLVFVCSSKIIFSMPYAWVICMLAFGLGVLAAPSGQNINKIVLLIIQLLSIFFIIDASCLLIGLSWFELQVNDVYYYEQMLQDKLINLYHLLKAKLNLDLSSYF